MRRFFDLSKNVDVKPKMNMESYRSGHNGPDSKSGSLHGLEGSNPSLSAMKVLKIVDVERFSALSLLLDFRHLHASFMQKRGAFCAFFGKT